jgi:hypothetical protein
MREEWDLTFLDGGLLISENGQTEILIDSA